MKTKNPLGWVVFWIGLAVAFNIGVYIFEGPNKAMEFTAGYLIELSLSIDNLFLFITIFTAFKVTELDQHKALNYGIFGAIILRLIFIMMGVAIVSKFEWVLYVFGAILIFSGVKMAFEKEKDKDIKDSKILKMVGKVVKMTDTFENGKFTVIKDGVRYFTPLFAIVILIECTDIMFAIDSIPAVFSISRDPFIVYTSNIFAIMGLRSFYFVIRDLHEKFSLVKYGIAFILTFTGVKLAGLYFDLHISIPMSISIIAGTMVIAIVASIINDKRKHPKE